MRIPVIFFELDPLRLLREFAEFAQESVEPSGGVKQGHAIFSTEGEIQKSRSATRGILKGCVSKCPAESIMLQIQGSSMVFVLVCFTPSYGKIPWVS